MRPLTRKDDALAELAMRFNVAAFFSVRPGRGLHHVVFPSETHPSSVPEAVRLLLELSGSKTVNVRTFAEVPRKSLPFVYGLDDPLDVVRVVDDFLADGLNCIVNETIDVADGGVSGVAMEQVIEFVPEDTPRGVDGSGVASFSTQVATSMLEIVYGHEATVPVLTGTRIEFSIHPRRVGVRREHTVVWEQEPMAPSSLASPQGTWPNRFSAHIGDKTFGLLVADILGFLVPRTLVIPRKVPPFYLGTSTGSTEIWTRTAPAYRSPGHYTTLRGWTDIFDLLSREDANRDIAAVLRQDEVEATYSGAAMLRAGQVTIEGVAGEGDSFMLGEQSPSELPGWCASEVERTLRDLSTAVSMDVSMEWAIDDSGRVWVLQLHVSYRGENAELVEGRADKWVKFDPRAGVRELELLLERIRGTSTGVELTQSVGRTSHVGDLLRASGTPARFAQDVDATF